MRNILATTAGLDNYGYNLLSQKLKTSEYPGASLEMKQCICMIAQGLEYLAGEGKETGKVGKKEKMDEIVLISLQMKDNYVKTNQVKNNTLATTESLLIPALSSPLLPFPQR